MSAIEGNSLEVIVDGVVCELDNIRFNIDMINDFDGENEDGVYLMSKENYDWWFDYLEQYGMSQDLIIDNIEDGLFNEDYHNYINGVEFNDLPEVMRNFYEENK